MQYLECAEEGDNERQAGLEASSGREVVPLTFLVQVFPGRESFRTRRNCFQTSVPLMLHHHLPVPGTTVIHLRTIREPIHEMHEMINKERETIKKYQTNSGAEENNN